MTTRLLATLRVVLGFAFVCALMSAPYAAAQAAEPPTREAAKHFQRGVALYSEADYRGALVEFRRAYALAPNAAVLYDVGQTEYQLHDYAAALTTFERYLADAAPGESHRSEVTATVETLRTRVGRLTITSVPAGADISVDDQPIGKTPFEKPVLVSIGRRKLTASMPGRSAASRYVDVAADDNVNVSLQLGSAAVDTSPRLEQQGPSSAETAGPWRGGASLRIAGLIATGALAAGAATFGLLSIKKAHDLDDSRAQYPITSSALSHEARVTTTYAVLADSLGAAAVVVGGLTLYSVLTSSTPSSRNTGVGPKVSLGLGSASFETAF